MNIVKNSIIVFCLALTGCTYISKATNTFNAHDKDYLTAKSIPPLKIPPGLASSSFQNLYPIPDRYYPVSAERVSEVPPGLMSA